LVSWREVVDLGEAAVWLTEQIPSDDVNGETRAEIHKVKGYKFPLVGLEKMDKMGDRFPYDLVWRTGRANADGGEEGRNSLCSTVAIRSINRGEDGYDRT
jgi:hypothetical protein